MKYIITALLVFFSQWGLAQESNIDELGLMLENYRYPYTVSNITLNNQAQQLKMAYMDVKPKSYNGKNVLLLHGKNFNGAYWGTTIEALIKQGYRVIVPDQIGFGKSSKPEHYQYSFQQLAENTKEVLDTLQINKVSVVGHSMGGMLAARFTLMFPDIVEKFILVNPIGLEDYKLKVPYKSIDWWYNNELQKDYDAIKNYQKQNYYDGKWEKGYDEWVNILAGWTKNEKYPIIAWNSALTYDMIFTQPVVYEFEHISAPTLLIIGTRDRTALGKPLVNEEVRKTMGLYYLLGKQTQKKIPNAKLVEIEKVGHLPHIEAFEKFFIPLSEFLKDN